MAEQSPWPYESPERRWYALGRYYAMFPPGFAYDAICHLTSRGDGVIDPFCGRGNAPFTASVGGRPALGIDINPVAWLFSAAKLNLEPDPARVMGRLEEISRAARRCDRKPRSRFETMAWSPDVRAFLKAARRELDWKESATDRVLMAFVALHMQDKQGAGLSNGLWPTIACSPHYAVKWWAANGHTRPPDIDPIQCLKDKIRRRYAYGVPYQADSYALLGDASSVLQGLPRYHGNLLITSPPYNGVTDYWNDHWIRLWLLGHPMRQNWRRSAKYENRYEYGALLESVFARCKMHLRRGAAVLVRSDRRHHTSTLCQAAMKQVWPKRALWARESDAPHRGVSRHHGRGGSKAREIDFLLLGKLGKTWAVGAGFRPIEEISVRRAKEEALSQGRTTGSFEAA